jgi:hypothetical protein
MCRRLSNSDDAGVHRRKLLPRALGLSLKVLGTGEAFGETS